MVFYAIFNNISVISWRSVLLVDETGVPGENQRPVANHWQTFSRKCCFEYISPPAGFELTTLVVKGIDCIILIGFFIVVVVAFTITVYIFYYEIHLKYYQDTTYIDNRQFTSAIVRENARVFFSPKLMDYFIQGERKRFLVEIPQAMPSLEKICWLTGRCSLMSKLRSKCEC